MLRFPERLIGLALVLVTAPLTARAIAATADANAKAAIEPITMEIVEGLPEQRDWNFTPGAATERFSKPAFAFVGLPQNYSPRGIAAARKYPILVRTSGPLSVSPGEYRILLRAKGAARLYCDGRLIAETQFRVPNVTGDEPVPEPATIEEPGLRPLPPGEEQVLVHLTLTGAAHDFRLEAIVGDQKLRPEIGELCVGIAAAGEDLRLLAPAAYGVVPLTEQGWNTFAADAHARLEACDAATRREASAAEDKYWARRHELARRSWQQLPPLVVPAAPDSIATTIIDRFLAARAESVSTPEEIDDCAFLRRVSLDLVGVIPSRREIEAFLADPADVRRAWAVDRLLADPRWADSWVGYWQDVLAENPGLVKPELNNTGPFRAWIYESLRDNKPIDRFATELVMMEGGPYTGTPGGFALATQNDAPLAEKAHTLAAAFLAVELKCARCHDSPLNSLTQQDTFSLAAMLSRGSVTLPATSTVPAMEGGRKPAVEISLKPGDKIAPAWRWTDLAPAAVSPALLHNPSDTREQLAALMTSPRNARFPQVIVNRLWKRYFGWGLVEPVDDWTDPRRANPELLKYLARELVTHDYDLKHVTRLIMNSAAYARSAGPAPTSGTETLSLTGPVRRRMSAEQLVDSLFAATGKGLGSEPLDFDPEGRRPAETFWNLGTPRRAWQMASLSNERDRPALSLPVAQSLVDLLGAFGWRESRPNPLTDRDESANVMQPLMLANGPASHRAVRLSDDSEILTLCLTDAPLEQLIQDMFLQVLSRDPRPDEQQLFYDLLAPGYDQRRQEVAAQDPIPAERHVVSWSNHLSPEATRIKLEAEKSARAGDPPTRRLSADWRERMEDMVWALVNSPEFVFLP